MKPQPVNSEIKWWLPLNQSGLRRAAPDPTLPLTYSSGHRNGLIFATVAVSWALVHRNLECWKLERGLSPSYKNIKWSHLSQFQACLSILQMAHVALLISQGMFCFSSFYFAGLASSPRQKTYLHLSPQSRLFPGTLYVVMVLPSVILTHAWACLSLFPGQAVPSRGQVVPGYWPQHALSLRAGICPVGPTSFQGPRRLPHSEEHVVGL